MYQPIYLNAKLGTFSVTHKINSYFQNCIKLSSIIHIDKVNRTKKHVMYLIYYGNNSWFRLIWVGEFIYL